VGINDKQETDSVSASSRNSANPYGKSLKRAEVKNEAIRDLMMMFFSFCDPIETRHQQVTPI